MLYNLSINKCNTIAFTKNNKKWSNPQKSQLLSSHDNTSSKDCFVKAPNNISRETNMSFKASESENIAHNAIYNFIETFDFAYLCDSLSEFGCQDLGDDKLSIIKDEQGNLKVILNLSEIDIQEKITDISYSVTSDELIDIFKERMQESIEYEPERSDEFHIAYNKIVNSLDNHL